MEIKELIERVLESKEYKEWDKKHDHHLAHVFKMVDEKKWQFGFFCAEDNSMTSFILDGDALTLSEPSEVFKKPGDTVRQLDPEKIHLDWPDALAKAKELQEQEYPKELVFKRFFILQNLDGAVYNITFVTKAFNTINVRVSAADGSVISHKLESLMDLGDWQKGEKE